MGCYIWYSEEGPGRGRSPPRPLLAVPNVTAHPSAANVPITVLPYSGPLLCGFNAPVKGSMAKCAMAAVVGPRPVIMSQETLLSLTGRARHYVTVLSVNRNSRTNCSYDKVYSSSCHHDNSQCIKNRYKMRKMKKRKYKCTRKHKTN